MASVIDVNSEQLIGPEDVPVVRDFLEVFPEDLPGLPPDRDIEFMIDLLPGTTLIYKAPYKTASAELLRWMNEKWYYGICSSKF